MGWWVYKTTYYAIPFRGEREREEKRQRAVTIATSHLMVLMLLRRHKTPSSRDTLTNTAYPGKFCV